MGILGGSGINPGDILKKAMESEKSGDLSSEKGVNDFINSNLSAEQAEKLKNVLSDERKTKKILESDAAKELFKKLTGGKGNG